MVIPRKNKNSKVVSLNKKGIYVFRITGRPVPKARPRYDVKTKKMYLPKTYRQSQARLKKQFKAYFPALASPLVNYQVKVLIELYGKFLGDLDNIAGAYLDAMVKAKILKDDRITIVRTLSVDLVKTLKKPIYSYAIITIKPHE